MISGVRAVVIFDIQDAVGPAVKVAAGNRNVAVTATTESRGDSRIPRFTRNSLAMRFWPHAGFLFVIRRIKPPNLKRNRRSAGHVCYGAGKRGLSPIYGNEFAGEPSARGQSPE